MNGENIYTWLWEPRAPPPKAKRHVSGYKTNPVPIVASTFQPLGATAKLAILDPKAVQRQTGTFGPADCKPRTDNYLKAGSKMAKTAPGRVPFPPPNAKAKSLGPRVPKIKTRLPIISTRESPPVHGLRSGINFVQRNALDAILSDPPPAVLSVEERPAFTHPSQGRVPDYLAGVQAQAREEREAEERYDATLRPESVTPLELLDEAERAWLREKMQERWNQVHAKYQRISIHTTVECHRRRHKEAWEKELTELQRHIDLFSRPGPVYIKE